jgi:hypothetical protein
MLAINIRGLAENATHFRNMPQHLTEELKITIRETCIVDIETQAKLKLTRDGHVDTGRLRSSIHTEYQGSQRILPGTLKSPLSAIVGTNVEYAKYVERMDSYLAWAARQGIPKLKERINETISRVIS